MVHSHHPLTKPLLITDEWQRIDHILSSYCLWGQHPHHPYQLMTDLLDNYPAPLVELAVVEVLVDQWLAASLPRGLPFLDQVIQWLGCCSTDGFELKVLPPQFQQITGLDPNQLYPQLPRFLVWTGDRLFYMPSPEKTVDFDTTYGVVKGCETTKGMVNRG